MAGRTSEGLITPPVQETQEKNNWGTKLTRTAYLATQPAIALHKVNKKKSIAKRTVTGGGETHRQDRPKPQENP
jgi:hypothetical protein